MATDFSAKGYIQGLQKLMNLQGVKIRVQGFETVARDYDKMSEGPIAELQIDEFPTEATGELGSIDGTLTASLIVMMKLNTTQSEADCFQLALDVATALTCDASDRDGNPLFRAGPFQLKGIEPEVPDGALLHRVVAFAVSYEQQMRISRAQTGDGLVTGVFLGRDPDVGEGHEDDYTQIYPRS